MEESYGELNLNYKGMAQEKKEYAKKKALLEPKKMSKGVSFEEELAVASKYYESELNDI